MQRKNIKIKKNIKNLENYKKKKFTSKMRLLSVDNQYIKLLGCMVYDKWIVRLFTLKIIINP